MGVIRSRWCFAGFDKKAGRKPYCPEAIIDLGAVVPVVPEREAKRLGEAVRQVAPDIHRMLTMPKDAQGRVVPGDYYLLGGVTSRAHGCRVEPVLVFGQRGAWRRSRTVIGREPLQAGRAIIRMGEDTMRCRRLVRGARSLGARVYARDAIKRQMPKGEWEV